MPCRNVIKIDNPACNYHIYAQTSKLDEASVQRQCESGGLDCVLFRGLYYVNNRKNDKT